MADLDDIRARLADLAEELADLALDRLREATSLGRSVSTEDGEADAVARATAEERRLTRARRSVERAVSILSDGDDEET